MSVCFLGQNSSIGVNSAMFLQHFKFTDNSMIGLRFFLFHTLIQMRILKLGSGCILMLLVHVDAFHILDPTRLVQSLQLTFTLALALKMMVVLTGVIDFFGTPVFL